MGCYAQVSFQITIGRLRFRKIIINLHDKIIINTDVVYEYCGIYDNDHLKI